MTAYDTTRGGKGGGTFELLETDVYRCKIKRATIEQDTYGEPDEAGNYPDKLVLIWEVSAASEEQPEEVIGLSVWQRLVPWYGTGKRGPSQFKTLMDSLAGQALIAEFDPAAFDPESLVGVEQRVSVEKYIKTMGPNAGQPGNKVKQVLPIRRAKAAAPAAKPASAPKAAAAPAPARRNAPVAVAEEGEGEDLF
jgi:hypothetical protein